MFQGSYSKISLHTLTCSVEKVQCLNISGCFAGHNLSTLPVEPKLGKMLILGAIFNCLDPIMTVVAGLSVRDPFLMPFDKKDVCSFTVKRSK